MADPQRNRVQPTGEIVASSARGLYMGNRGGPLPDRARPWHNRTWLVCDLTFRGRSRANTGRAKYTKLFFLDEAVAFAAGHRPCAFCRRGAFNTFRARWADTFGASPSASAIDGRLHAERIDAATRTQKRTVAVLDDLPLGAFVMRVGGGSPALVLENALVRYTPAGYGPSFPRPKGMNVTVLTPPSTLAVLRAGYRPELHPEAGALAD